MNAKPFFTCAVPTYNRAEMLRQAINAILGQTFTDFELIISDNASTDGTQKAVQEFSDPRIQYVRRPKNVGAINNFNLLLGEARGEFFLIHQDDDMLHKTFLERCHRAVQNRPDVAFFSAPVWVGEYGKGYMSSLFAAPAGTDMDYMIKDTPVELAVGAAAVKLLISFPFCFPAVAMRTEFLHRVGGFFNEFEYASDLVTLARLSALGKVLYDSIPGAYNRQHGSNSSAMLKKSDKLLCQKRKFYLIIRSLEEKKIAWENLLAAELSQMTFNRVTMELNMMGRYYAPGKLQEILWGSVFQMQTGSRIKFWKRLVSRVSPKNLVRMVINRYFGCEDMYPY